MLPLQIDLSGVEFQLAPAGTGKANAEVARGQTIPLPAGNYNRILILGASADQDQKALFRAGDKSAELNIQYWSGFIGQWDNRVWKNQPAQNWAISATHAPWPPPNEEQREARIPSPRYPDDYVGLEAGFVKPAGLAWYVSHHHTVDGLNEPYQYSYLFAYTIDVPAGVRTLTLPDNDKIRILAVSVAEDNPALKAAAPLYDTLNETEPPQTIEQAAR
jgi:alpha-mannosidase